MSRRATVVRRRGAGRALEVHRLALDEGADADDGVDAPRKGEEARRGGQLPGPGDLRREDVLLEDADLEAGLLGPVRESVDDLRVPLRPDDPDPRVASVEAVEGDLGAAPFFFTHATAGQGGARRPTSVTALASMVSDAGADARRSAPKGLAFVAKPSTPSASARRARAVRIMMLKSAAQIVRLLLGWWFSG